MNTEVNMLETQVMIITEGLLVSVWLPKKKGTIQICPNSRCGETKQRSDASLYGSYGSRHFTEDLTSLDLKSLQE